MATQNTHGIVRKAVRLSAVALAMLAGCSSPSAPRAESARLPIVGGTNAPLCAWPSVVFLSNYCSGTLVHPQVVITAAHCTNGKEAPMPTSVSFGEKALDSPEKTVKVSKCKASPKFTGADKDDIGYCVLAQPVTDLPIIPVMAACEASVLKAGVDIMEIGYGQFTAKSGANDGFGVKRFIAAKIDSVNSNGQTKVTTGNQNGEYFGDSGGPILVQMADKTWRVIGADCCSDDIVPGSTAPRISIYTSTPLNVAWLESDSGFDLTPCHDGSTWSPGSLCSTLPTTPDKASGGWSTMCAATQGLTAPQATCNASGGAGGTSGASGSSGSGGSRADAGGGGDAGSPDAGVKADARDATNRDGKDGGSGRGGNAGAGGATGGSSAGTGGDAGSTGNTDTGGSNKGGVSGFGGIAGTGGTLGANGGSVASHGGSSAGKGGSSQSGGIAGTGGTLGASGGSVASHGGSSAGKGGSSGSGKTTSEAKSSGSGCSCGVAAAGRPGAWQALAAALGLLALHHRRRRRR